MVQTLRTLALALWFLLAVLLVMKGDANAVSTDVVTLNVKGAVSPVMASYIDRGISSAENRGAAAVVIQLDTPGGLDSSMRDIVQRINRSQVPVVVYVSPSGARAASAGAFITMAAHVAAMAPNTAIGAAHPVAGGGEQLTETQASKATNDAAAFIKSIADLRGRNAVWAEKAVRDSISATVTEAVQDRVVDMEAVDLQALLLQIDGREVALISGKVTIETKGRQVLGLDMNVVEKFLFAIG
ncbi:MAG: rane-bound serine protease, partial [Dehalococcoidia bacterium]|nr:rane-bound serine protease [Dehalococcoidia bacterium]